MLALIIVVQQIRNEDPGSALMSILLANALNGGHGEVRKCAMRTRRRHSVILSYDWMD